MSADHATAQAGSAFRASLGVLRGRAPHAADCAIDTLFTSESGRLARLSFELPGLYLDISRSRLPLAELPGLLRHAEAAGWRTGRDRMFAGEPVNRSENRAALHVALRAARAMPLGAGGADVMPGVMETLRRMRGFATAVRDGTHRGAGGAPITDVVALGIGGSSLGPQLACEALAGFAHPRLRIHFIASVDPAAWAGLRPGLSAPTTLAVIASKTWSTAETLGNAEALRAWLLASGVPADGLHRHLAGITARPDRAQAFGLRDSTLFSFEEWVGGRYSLWSAIGLPVMLSIGADAFDELLAGARELDEHFRDAPLERNAPAMLALLSLWNALGLGVQTEAVIPYSHPLRRLPAYLQQLQMESNGKSVDVDGTPVDYPSAAVTWGEPGTEAQHSFFQALHQGHALQPVDFVLVAPPPGAVSPAIVTLLANGLAQAEALLRGDPAAATPHQRCPGNRPSTTILLDGLRPRTLGALLALYEHKTASLGWLLRINSFDQWGVELGKRIALRVEALLRSPELPLPEDMDPSTAALVARLSATLPRGS